MYWVFGNLPEFIDMRGNKTSEAFVRGQSLGVVGPIETAKDLKGMVRHIYRLGYQKECMVTLAGYAAQSRVDDELCGKDWYDILVVNGEWASDDDLTRAVSAATVFYGDNGNAWRFLKRMASWTDEAFNHPQLWAGVESLAERLQSVRTRITGDRVFDIMNKAWPNTTLPYWNMGKKWRRRFRMPSPKS
jgi:hypothetical protein